MAKEQIYRSVRNLLVVALILFAPPCLATWKLHKSVDSMTDKVTKDAYVVSSGGDRFTLLRKSDGRVWGYLQLAGMNQFKVNDALMLRVDKNKPVPISDPGLENLGIHAYEWNPSLLGFLLWHGKVNEGCGYIRDLLSGKRLVIRYHPNQSTYRDVTFHIAKNKAAIRQGIGLSSNDCK